MIQKREDGGSDQLGMVEMVKRSWILNVFWRQNQEDLLKNLIWGEKKLKMTPSCLSRAIRKVGLHLTKMAMSIRDNVYKEKVWKEMNNLVSKMFWDVW